MGIGARVIGRHRKSRTGQATYNIKLKGLLRHVFLVRFRQLTGLLVSVAGLPL